MGRIFKRIVILMLL